MINALLIFAAACVGFGGAPWAGAAIGACLIVLLGIPHQRDVLRRYRGQPVTDIVLAMVFEVGMAVAAAIAGAWVGYGLRQVLALLR